MRPLSRGEARFKLNSFVTLMSLLQFLSHHQSDKVVKKLYGGFENEGRVKTGGTGIIVENPVI